MVVGRPKLALAGLALVLLGLGFMAYDGGSVPDNTMPSVTVDTDDSAADAAMRGDEILRISDIDFMSYSRELAISVDLELTEPIEIAAAKIERYFTPKGGKISNDSGIGSETESIFTSFDAEGGKVMVVERLNMRDDSVKAQQFYAIFKKLTDAEVLVDYGMKIKCARGNNTENWQTELCP